MVTVNEKNRKPKAWFDVPMLLKLSKRAKTGKALVLAVMVMEEYAKRGGAPIKGDADSLAKLIHERTNHAETLTATEEMRTDLLLLFDQDQDGYLKPKPGLVELREPYATEDDDGE